MKNVGERLTDWAIQKIEKDFREDVCLLIEHTTLQLDKDIAASSFSHYIPATTRANGLARDFIIDGIGYDLFPTSWERMEKMADMRDYNTTCLADGRILYARNETDRKRYLSLQAKLRANLANPVLMRTRAMDWVNAAMESYFDLLFEDTLQKARTSAANICDTLSLSVAFFHGQYFKHGQTNQIQELRVMPSLPQDFVQLYERVVHAKTVDELRRTCHEMIRATKAFHAAGGENVSAKKQTPNFSELAMWYQEMSYTWRRVYHFCDVGEAVNAFIWCCYLQQEVDTMGPTYGIEDLDMYGAFDADNLPAFRKRLEAVEQAFIAAIQASGTPIESYADIDEFLAANT